MTDRVDWPLVQFRQDDEVPPLLRGHYAHITRVRYIRDGGGTVPVVEVYARLWVTAPFLTVKTALLQPVAADAEARHDFLYDTEGKVAAGGAWDGRLNQAISEWETLLRQFFGLIQRDLVTQMENPAFWLAKDAQSAIRACGASETHLNDRSVTAWEHAVVGSRLLAEEVHHYTVG